MNTDSYWEKHELLTLIRHHEQQAKEQKELADMFTDVGEEEDRKSFLRFVALREQRAAELQLRLTALGG